MTVQTTKPPRVQGATEAFLLGLAAAGRHPLLHNVTGVVRFEITGPDKPQRLYVIIEREMLRVTSRSARADAVIRADEGSLDAMVEGRMNTTTAMLRGVVVIEGDLRLVSALARLFPGPPRPMPADAIPGGTTNEGA